MSTGFAETVVVATMVIATTRHKVSISCPIFILSPFLLSRFFN